MQRNSSVKFCDLPWTAEATTRPLRLIQTLPILESDSIRQISTSSHTDGAQKKKSQPRLNQSLRTAGQTNQKPNTKSALIDPQKSPRLNPSCRSDGWQPRPACPAGLPASRLGPPRPAPAPPSSCSTAARLGPEARPGTRAPGATRTERSAPPSAPSRALGPPAAPRPPARLSP